MGQPNTLSPTKHVLFEYRSLVAKLDLEAGNCHAMAKVMATWLDLEVMLGLACLIPMFECVHALIKLAQVHDIYLCDFLIVVKVY